MGLLPFLDKPVELHSFREDMCMLTPSQCAYLRERWHNWYQADHVYAYNTIYFMIAFIGVFGIANVSKKFIKPAQSSSPVVQRLVASLRYLSYRGYLFHPFNWVSPSLGTLIMGAFGFIYFSGLTLGPKSYYWSNSDFGSSPPIATRAGWMSLALLPFILILATKANMITTVTGVPHEKLQVFHRWCAYAMLILALIHTFPFIINNLTYGTMVESWKTTIFYWSGVAALIPQAYLTFFSVGPLRDRFYEFFKATHYFVALVFIFFLFLHCDHTLSSWDYFIAAGSLYLASLFYSQIRTYLGYGMRQAYLSTISGTYIQVVIPVKAADSAKAAVPIGLKWKPGQHIFVRFLGRGLNHISGHPFTICSVCPTSDAEVPELRFIIHPHRGLTGSLGQLARDQPGKPIPVLLDGPYGGPRSGSLSDNTDKLIIIAGGSGAGFTLPLIEDAIRKSLTSDAEKGGKRASIHVVLATRVPETPDWYRSEILALLDKYNTSIPITVSIHTTGSAASTTTSKDVSGVDPTSESSDQNSISKSTKTTEGCFHMHIGRPNLPQLILEEASEKDISLALAVCGPVTMLNDVRNAAADAQRIVLSGNGARGVYMHSERFGW